MTARRPGLKEVAALWIVLGLVAVATVVTYARLPPESLYHVSESGLAGGLGRALVYVSFPVAIAALGTLPFVVDRLGRRARAAGVLAAVLCAVVVVPGVVDQDDLDAKWVNAVPAIGVAIVVALLVAALRRAHAPVGPFDRLDRVRLALAVALVVASAPWICAEVGVYASDLPLAGGVFLAEQLRPNPGGAEATLEAVHLGRHHGMDGTLLALAGLVLWRVLPGVQGASLRRLAAFAVAALLVYGLLNAAQDFWFEQVVKRGWTDETPPSFLRPGLTAAWFGLLLAVAAVFVALRRSEQVTR